MSRSLAFALPFALAFAVGCNTGTTTDSNDGGSGGTTADGGSGGEGGAPVKTDAECKKEGFTGECTFGTQRSCGFSEGGGEDLMQSCIRPDQTTCVTQWDQGACNTPLVLSFDRTGVEFVADASHSFDLSGAQSQVNDWPTAKTPWLAIDVNGNGSIDDGSELFGSMSKLSTGKTASNGFIALRELDTDGDGKITENDAGFSKLMLWTDKNGDRLSTADELTSLASVGIVSIDLGYSSVPRCDQRGNCEVERATFRFKDSFGVERTGDVVDVHVPAQR